MKIIHTGETPNAQIITVLTNGIHALLQVSFADLAIENTGNVIKATTAGRIPLKIASTH